MEDDTNDCLCLATDYCLWMANTQARCLTYLISNSTRTFKGKYCYITYWGSWGLEKTGELSKCTLLLRIMGILTQVSLTQSRWSFHCTSLPGWGQPLYKIWHSRTFILQRKWMDRTERKIDTPWATEISFKLGAGRQQGLPFLMDYCHSILCRRSYPEQAAFINSHNSVRCFITGINLIYM